MHKETPKQQIILDNVTSGYNGEPIIEDINFKLEGPSLIQIIGPNGAGKTTLLKTIIGLIKPIKGKVIINGIEVTGRPEKAGRLIGYVPQMFISYTSNFPITVWEFIENSLLLYKKKWPRFFARKDDRKIIKSVLKAVGLPEEVWYENFWNLSGGQKQRVLIARALVHDPPILIMDEPLSAVDPLGKVELTNIINYLSRSRLVIVTCHDPMILLEHTDLVILLNRKIYAMGNPKEVLKLDKLRKIYGEACIQVSKNHVHIFDFHA